MWKDFFYFSKGERKAIVFLLGMIVTIIGVWLVSPYLIEESSKETGQESFEEMERFLAGIQTIEHKRNASFKKKEVVKRKVILAPFEPNLTDSIEFLQLGLPPFIAHNIIKYRQAGGKFATAEALTIVLELLPLGAVCIFATSPTERVKETFSYFSLTPFGYANFAPLITATLTVAIFLLSLFSLKKKGVLKALFVLSIITVVISLLPLMYGLNYYTLVGAFITVTLVIESILAKIQQK